MINAFISYLVGKSLSPSFLRTVVGYSTLDWQFFLPACPVPVGETIERGVTNFSTSFHVTGFLLSWETRAS